MMFTNIMKCPKCNFEQLDKGAECIKCGIVFEKYRERREKVSGKDATSKGNIKHSFKPSDKSKSPLVRLLLYPGADFNPLTLCGRSILLMILLFWSWKFILSPIESDYIGQSFLHSVNLIFHEAGHTIFRFFGKFIMTLGGSLGQLLVPLICMTAFLFRTRDTFAASVSFWWLGENFIDMAPYINDARSLTLILLGGVTGRDVTDYHDWEYILRKLGWLKYDHTLAVFSKTIGSILMIAAMLWGGYILYRQFRYLKEKRHIDGETF